MQASQPTRPNAAKEDISQGQDASRLGLKGRSEVRCSAADMNSCSGDVRPCVPLESPDIQAR